MDTDDLREGIQHWCEENGEYALAQRIAFVPEDVLKRLLGMKPEAAVRLLEDEGY